MLNYFLASLVAGSGIILGAVLRDIAKEEIKPGIRYFILMKNIVFAAAVLAASYFYMDVNIMISSLLLIFIVLISVKRFQPLLMYAAFAVLCLLSMKKPDSFILISSLIFIAGFPIGTLIEGKGKSGWIKILIPYIIFVCIIALEYAIQFFL